MRIEIKLGPPPAAKIPGKAASAETIALRESMQQLDKRQWFAVPGSEKLTPVQRGGLKRRLGLIKHLMGPAGVDIVLQESFDGQVVVYRGSGEGIVESQPSKPTAKKATPIKRAGDDE